MKGIILSAGFGTRLMPLTETKPKALIEYRNVPMIEHQIKRLQNAGVTEIFINVHHHADKMLEYFEKNTDKFETGIFLKRENEILGTGGGILNFSEQLKDEEFFYVINVDVDTDFEITKLKDLFVKKKPLAVIAIQDRGSKRKLEFTDDLRLIGRQTSGSDAKNLFAFNGIHLISNSIFEYNSENKYSDIFDVYFELMKKYNLEVYGYDTGECNFKDLGKIENL